MKSVALSKELKHPKKALNILCQLSVHPAIGKGLI